MWLNLLPLVLLLAGAAGQKYYYVGTTTTIRDTEFYLVTRKEGMPYYEKSDQFTFNAESPSSAFLLEIMDFDVGFDTYLNVYSGTSIVLSSKSIAFYEMAMATPSKYLRVSFSILYSVTDKKRGVTLRVRAFDLYGCPPEWTRIDKTTCYGNAVKVTGKLSFQDSQIACKIMRSNLLQVPANNIGNIQEYLGKLPENLTMDYAWIGLTDRYNMGSPYWLNSVWQKYTNEISCLSGGSYSECTTVERCAAQKLTPDSPYTLYMEVCTNSLNYICSMPPTGTDTFYPVPDLNYPTTGHMTTASDQESTASTTQSHQTTSSQTVSRTTTVQTKSTQATLTIDTQTPTTQTPTTQTPNTQTPNTQTPNTQTPNTQAPTKLTTQKTSDISKTTEPTEVPSTTRVQPKVDQETSWFFPLLIFASVSSVIFWVAILVLTLRFVHSVFVLKSAAPGKRASVSFAVGESLEQGILEFSGNINDATLQPDRSGRAVVGYSNKGYTAGANSTGN